MSRRLLAILALVAALGLGTPALMADHGDKGHKHQHGNKHFDDDDDQGWERRDHSFSRLTPFVEVGIANTIPDSRLFMRPYTTLGFNSHYRAGANYDLWKFFTVGASGYDILPSGQQTIFSKIVPGSNAGPVSHGRVFQNSQQTTGTADIAKDKRLLYLD